MSTTSTTSTTSTAANVPKLRFPGFEGEWKDVPLGSIADIKLGKMLDKAKHTSGRLLPYLNNISLRWNDVDTSNLPQMYFDADEFDRFGLKAGDVVVCEGGEPGRSAVWDGRLPDLKFQKAIHRVRFNVPFEPRLLVLYLENIAGTTRFEMLFTGGGIKHLTRETFASLNVPLIPYPEQQKIAGFLTAVDGRIVQLSRKKALLEATKKGVMQQLFTQTLRFQDDHGHDFPDWEGKTPGDVVELLSGQHLGPDDYNENGEGVPYFTGPSDFTSDPSSFTKWTTQNTKIARPDSVLITVKGNGVGRVMYSTLEQVALGRQLMALRSSSCDNRYLYQFLLTKAQEFVALGSGNLIPGLSRGDILTMALPLPSLPEQKKIAGFLSALDGKIAAVGEQLSRTQAWKKGLLQQLFV